LHPFAFVVKGNLSRVIADAAAGTQADAVDVHAVVEVEPEFGVVGAGVVFDEDELCPAHGFVEDAGRCRGWYGLGKCFAQRESTGGEARSGHEFTTINAWPFIHRHTCFTTRGRSYTRP